MRSRRPDAWVYAEIQWDNLLDQKRMQPLHNLPGEGIYQHTLNRPYWERVERELTPEYTQRLPTQTNVFRCQFASQWNGDRRTERVLLQRSRLDGDGQEGRARPASRG